MIVAYRLGDRERYVVQIHTLPAGGGNGKLDSRFYRARRCGSRDSLIVGETPVAVHQILLADLDQKTLGGLILRIEIDYFCCKADLIAFSVRKERQTVEAAGVYSNFL